MNLRKEPWQCRDMNEVRKEIDKIDHQIIELFADRMKYVEEIVRFKKDEKSVIAAARKEQVISDRAAWAKGKGLDPEVFKRIYTLLVERNIEHELELLKTKTEE